jgi:hypothetical protein
VQTGNVKKNFRTYKPPERTFQWISRLVAHRTQTRRIIETRPRVQDEERRQYYATRISKLLRTIDPRRIFCTQDEERRSCTQDEERRSCTQDEERRSCTQDEERRQY